MRRQQGVPQRAGSKRWLCAQPRGDGLRRPFGPRAAPEKSGFMFMPSVPPEQDRGDGLRRPSDSCAASRWPGLCLCLLSCRSNPAKTACAALSAPAPLRERLVYVCALLSHRSNAAWMVCTACPARATLQRRSTPLVSPEPTPRKRPAPSFRPLRCRGDGLRRPSGPCVASEMTRVYVFASCPAEATPRECEAGFPVPLGAVAAAQQPRRRASLQGRNGGACQKWRCR